MASPNLRTLAASCFIIVINTARIIQINNTTQQTLATCSSHVAFSHSRVRLRFTDAKNSYSTSGLENPRLQVATLLQPALKDAKNDQKCHTCLVSRYLLREYVLIQNCGQKQNKSTRLARNFSLPFHLRAKSNEVCLRV